MRLKLETMTGTGRAITRTPLREQMEPKIFPAMVLGTMSPYLPDQSTRWVCRAALWNFQCHSLQLFLDCPRTSLARVPYSRSRSASEWSRFSFLRSFHESRRPHGPPRNVHPKVNLDDLQGRLSEVLQGLVTGLSARPQRVRNLANIPPVSHTHTGGASGKWSHLFILPALFPPV